MNDLRIQVKEVMGAAWKVAGSTIPDDAALNDYERWDSLGHMSVMLALAERFDFRLDSDNVQRCRSIPLIVEFLADRGAAEYEEPS